MRTTSYRQLKDFPKNLLQYFRARNVDVHLYKKVFRTSLYSLAPAAMSNFALGVQKWLGTNKFVRTKRTYRK